MHIYVYPLSSVIYVPSVRPSIIYPPVPLAIFIIFLCLCVCLCICRSVYLPTYLPTCLLMFCKELAHAVMDLPPASWKLEKAVDGVSVGV